ncbi:unnamed protein product [Cochlearia groenlandica]
MARAVTICLLFIVLSVASAVSACPPLVTTRKLLERKNHDILLTVRKVEKNHATHVTKSTLTPSKIDRFSVGRLLISAPSPGAGHSGGSH